MPRGERLGLTEDPVHLGAADGAGALRHAPARLADLDLAVEVPLLLALHAVAVVALRHADLLVSMGVPDPAGTRCGVHRTRAARLHPRGRGAVRPHPVDRAVDAMLTRWRVAVHDPGTGLRTAIDEAP